MSLKSSWTGTLSLGLLSLPARVESIISRGAGPESHQYSCRDGSRVKYKRVSEANPDREVAWSDIRYGYESSAGCIVLLKKDEAEAAWGESRREAQILMTVPRDQVPAIALGKPYVIEPAPAGTGKNRKVPDATVKAYRLLARALMTAGRVAIIEWGIRSRKGLAVIAPTASGLLTLTEICFAESVKSPDFGLPDVPVSEAEEKMAVSLVESLAGDFRWEQYQDEGAQRLTAMIEERGAAAAARDAGKPAEPEAASGDDLMTRLSASVEAARENREKAA